MLILGIDPGTASTGYGLIDRRGSKYVPVDYGLISTKAGTPQQERLGIIYSKITALLKEYKPPFASVEKLFFNRNVTNALMVGEARGVVLLACTLAGAKVMEYTPLQVKMALTGYGKADKRQVGEMVKMMLGLKKVPKPDDTADALAVAVCCASNYAYDAVKKEAGND